MATDVNGVLKLSRAGANLVKAFENCLKPVGGGQFRAYVCPAGVLTIGWGHTNHHGRKFDASTRWSQTQCDEAFNEDMQGFEDAVRRLVKVPLNQCQLDALVSFAYNCGEGNLQKSTLLKKVNRRDFAGAAMEFAKWNKGGGRVLNGLVRRRASEALLFQGISDTNYDGRPDRVQPKPSVGLQVDTPNDPPSVIPEAMPQQVDPPASAPEPKPLIKSKTVWGNTIQWLSGVGATFMAALAGVPWQVWVVLGVLILVGAFLVYKGRIDVQKVVQHLSQDDTTDEAM